MKKLASLLHILTILALVCSSGASVIRSAAAPQISDVVISQVYGGGGNAGALYRQDFIELYNRGAAGVSLQGWSLQYTSAAGTGLFGASATMISELPNFTLAPGQYFLVQEAQGAGGSVSLLDPDLVDATPIQMGATGGKVALVNSTTPLGCNGGTTGCSPTQLANIIDLVGYGNADFYEGAAAAPAPSNTTAALRNDGGAADTDQNAADFSTGAPTPRSSRDAAPGVVAVTPADLASGVALTTNLQIDFSEPVDVTPGWFQIACSASATHDAAVSGGAQSFTLDPLLDFVPGDLCTVTIFAAGVTDQDTADPYDAMHSNFTWSFSTPSCSLVANPIHAIQGSGASSPDLGQVRTVEGVVSAAYQGANQLGGFYIQESDAEGDPATSEGIFVQHAVTTVAAGDRVRVSGTVSELFGQTALTAASVEACGTAPLPPAEPLSLPFPADLGGVPFLERFEGMRVSLPAGLYVTEVYTLGRFGEFWLSAGDRLWNPTNVVPPGPGAVALQAANDLNRILVDDRNNAQNISPTLHPDGGLSAANSVRVGDVTATGLTGVLAYDFAQYRLQPDAAAAFNVVNPRPPATLNNDPYLTVASFNVLNYFNGNGDGTGFPTSRGADTLAEFTRQRAKIIQAIHGLDADIIGLMELENDGFSTSASTPSAIADLVNGLNALAGAGIYAFVNAGVAAVGGDEITVGILYKPAVVSPLGAPAILTTGAFTQGAGRRHRPPLLQTFTDLVRGQDFSVVVNHFKSKGSCPAAGDENADQGDGQSCWNLARIEAATDLVAWLATDPTGSGDPDFIVIGDLNAYALEDPLTVFKDAGYLTADRGADRYSYLFEGQAGRLDHALISPSMAFQLHSAVTHHINADEPIAFDYNDYNQPNLYAADAYRSADHDPTLVRLALLPEYYLFLPWMLRFP